jgi:twitching motility protein PilU
MTDLHALLTLMVSQGASDLFLTCDASPHIKIEGLTHSVSAPPFRPGEVKRLAYSVMTDRQTADFEETMEANLSLAVEGVGRFRLNVYYQRGEVALVARLIKSRIPTIEQLGLPEACARLAMLKRGLVLVVGAAGAGKSTTLAALVGHRSASADGHILTIEDPIEFLFPHRLSLVDQREVNIDTHSFGDALRSAMRAAPDVIVIGEIRDEETARHAIAYAETGHLCISTMHSSNANQAIERLVNFFPEQAHRQLLMDLALNLQGVLSQRLVPAADGRRALATELLLPTSYVCDLVLKGRIDELREVMGKGSDVGMHTFDQSLYRLYAAGRIGLEDALRHADSRTDLALHIRLSGQRPAEEPSALTVNALPDRERPGS